MGFKNKVVLITGGTGGIGFKLVEYFANLEAKVILTGVNKDKFKANFSKFDKKIQYIELDFLSEKSIKKNINFIEGLDKIDILINNAGINKIDKIDKILEEDWEKINKVNLRGPFLMTKYVAKKLIKQRSGKIINISSIFGVISKEKRASYSSTKWGLIGFTKAVALDLAKYNIQVNSVSPGFVDTALTRKIVAPHDLNKIIESIPQKRLAKPEEIAHLVLFLSSDKNTYITGQNFIIDGGYTIV